MSNGSLTKVEIIAEGSPAEAFCNVFDLHEAIIGLMDVIVELWYYKRVTDEA